MEFEVSDEAAGAIAELLSDPSSVSEAPDDPASSSGLAQLKMTGTVQLRGFSSAVVNRISSNLRFRVDAVNLGARVRVIIDIQK
jgi:hypothetical protein